MNIGIDLGTTNSALAYIDPAQAENADFPPIHMDDAPGEIARVTLEAVVTETGMLQLWCVAKDGRRWKLEFNVRERVNQ